MNSEIKKQMILGEFTNDAALIITRNIKNFIWKKKIKRIKFTFENYYLKSTKNFLQTFTNFLNVWSAKYKINNLQFLKYRSTRLKEIKETLAILVIKKAIKNKKINISAGRILYQRLNKKIKKLQLAKLTETQEEDSQKSTKRHIHELMEQLENESISSSLERKLAKNLQLSKVSYQVKETGEFVIIPLLNQKKNYQDKAIERKFEKNKTILNKFRSLTIGTPPLVNHKRFYQSGELPSKLMVYSNQRYNSQERPWSSLPKHVSDGMNFLKPTEIFIRKISLDNENTTSTKKSVKIRPPSRRIMRNTISSISKKSSKRPMSESQISRIRKIKINKGSNQSDNKANRRNWKSFDMSISSNLLRRDFIL